MGLTSVEGRGCELRIEDNGIGFDPARVGKIGHQGLANIRGRAAQVGATVTIDSPPGAGSRVVVHLPELAT